MTNIKINTAVSYICQGPKFQLEKNSKKWSKSFEDAAMTDTAYITWREKFCYLTFNSLFFFNLLFHVSYI